MEDFLPLIAPETIVNELGSLHHNTISRRLQSGETVVEPRPTLPGNTRVATGDYGRGAFVHRGLPLFVTEDQIATSLASTALTASELNPNASAAFGILDSGSNRITIVQNAGYDGNYGSIFYGTDANNYQINSYQDTTNTKDISSDVAIIDGGFVSPDGLKFYTIDGAGEVIHEFDFGTPGQVDTLALANTQALPGTATGTSLNDLWLADDGAKVWLLTAGGGAINLEEFELSVAWDISSIGASPTHTEVITAVTSNGNAMCASATGHKIYVGDPTANTVDQFDLSTPNDLSTISNAAKSLDFSGEFTSVAEGIDISPDGSIMIVTSGEGVAYEYSLSTPFDASTASYASRSLDTGITYVQGTGWTADGDHLIFVGDDEVIYQFKAIDTFTELADADSPGTPSETIMVRGVAVLNGSVYAMDTNCKISACVNLDITDWNPLDFIKAQRRPDFGCFIGTHKDHVFALNTRSLEFFYDAANPTGSRLARRLDIFYGVGCVFPNSVTQLGDQTYFFGTNEHGDTDIYVLDNFALTPLGNEYIKKLLRAVDTPVYSNPYTSDPALFRQTLVAYSTPNNGVCLNMTINGETFNYNFDSGLVSKWYPGENVASATGLFTSNWATGQILPITSIYSGTAQGSTAYAILSNGYTTSFVYDSDLQDIGGSTAADSFCYLPKWNAGTLTKKRVLRYDLHQYPSFDTSLDPSTMTLQWVDLESDTGAALTDADFSTARNLSGIRAGSKIYRCGTTRERVHKFTFAPAKSQLVAGLKIYFEPVGA